MIKKKFVILFLLTLIFPLNGHAEKRLILGGKNFTEQYVLAEMAAVLLKQQGFKVTLKTGIGSTLLRKSLETAQVDLYFEYTGTAYTVYHKLKDRSVMCNPEKVFVAVKQTDASKGLIWLPPLDFNNTYTLLMQKQRAVELGIHAISDLGKYVNKHPDSLIFGMNPEFWERPDGFKSLMKTYGFRVPVKKIKKMATGICYTALKEGKTDVSMGFSTDGRVTAFGFVSLMDDKNFFPVYHPAPVVRKEVLDRYPEIKDILKPMTLINTKKMRSLNAAVDIEKKSAEKVAIKWAKEKKIWK